MNSKEQLYDFLEATPLAVISTIHTNGTPEAAVIGFGQTHDLEIVFGTLNTTRKYKNLIANPHVAFVMGWENGETVQYEGVVRELTTDEIDIVKQNYWRKNPHALTHGENPDERYFIVTPAWIRYTDLKAKPWHTFELTF